MSTPTAARTLAGILHATHSADQTRELLAAHAAEVLAEDADRTRLQQQRARAAQAGVLGEITAERSRQDIKFGPQNHRDGTGMPVYQHSARRYRNQAERAAAVGQLAWRDVLQEEVYEALAESDPAALRTELVQVAAVAVAWIEAIDRRAQPARPAPRTPSPLLVRELIEVTRAQTPAPTSPLCGEPVNLPGGRTATCSKLANHQNDWHRRGTDSWKTIFGNPKGRHIQRGATADELGKLRILARDWRTALQKIHKEGCTCCSSADTAQTALAQHPATKEGHL